MGLQDPGWTPGDIEKIRLDLDGDEIIHLTEDERGMVRDWMKDWLTKAVENMDREFTNEDIADMGDALRAHVGSGGYARAEDWDRLLLDVAGEHFPDRRNELQRATRNLDHVVRDPS